MVLRELLKLLRKLKQVHPEAGNADVWATDEQGERFPVNFVGLDKRHKPARVKLEK